MSRAASDVDAVVGIGRVAENAILLLVEGVHRAPRESDCLAQCVRLRRRVDVLPGGAGRALPVVADHIEPSRVA